MIQKDIQRWKLLKAVYDATGGKTGNNVECYDIAARLGFSKELTKDIIKYLGDSNLINDMSYGEVSMTHMGLKEVEKIIRNPERASDHFPANISQMESMHGEEIAETTVTGQKKYTIKELSDILDSLDYLLTGIKLSEIQLKDVKADIATCRAQMKRSIPIWTVVITCLYSVLDTLKEVYDQEDAGRAIALVKHYLGIA